MFSIKYVFPTKSLIANNDPFNISKIIPSASDKVIFSFFQTKAKHSKTQSLVKTLIVDHKEASSKLLIKKIG